MHVSRGVPLIVAQRRLSLRGLAALRESHADRPSWAALFMKAYALVAAEMPPLRRAYVKLPWPHLYEYPTSAGTIAIERDFDGEPGPVFVRVGDPEALPLRHIAAAIDEAKTPRFSETRTYRRMQRVTRLPLLLRRMAWWVALNSPRHRANYFGTFGVSAVSSNATGLVFLRSPVTSVLTYDEIDAAGGVTARIIFDHRVLDGMMVARALERLEDILMGPIAAELGGSAEPSRETPRPLQPNVREVRPNFGSA
jgi:hypothetical protein